MVKKVEYSRSINQCNLIITTITTEESNEIKKGGTETNKKQSDKTEKTEAGRTEICKTETGKTEAGRTATDKMEKDSIEMFQYNDIPYFLKFNTQKKDDAIQFYYDITGMQPLEQVLECRPLDYPLVKNILDSFDQACIQTENYMLSENDIALLPELLYINQGTNEILYCYLPGNQIHICVQFKRFMEYLMRHLDHKDKQAVQLVYGVYQQVAEEKKALHSVLIHAKNGWEQIIRDEQPSKRNPYGSTTVSGTNRYNEFNSTGQSYRANECPRQIHTFNNRPEEIHTNSYIKETGADSYIKGKETRSYTNRMGINSYTDGVDENSYIDRAGTNSYMDRAGADSYIDEVCANSYTNRMDASSYTNGIKGNNYTNGIKGNDYTNGMKADSYTKEMRTSSYVKDLDTKNGNTKEVETKKRFMKEKGKRNSYTKGINQKNKHKKNMSSEHIMQVKSQDTMQTNDNQAEPTNKKKFFKKSGQAEHKKLSNFFRKKIYTDKYQKIEDEMFFQAEQEPLDRPYQTVEMYDVPQYNSLQNKFIYQGNDRNRDFACQNGKKVLGSSDRYADICIPLPMVSKVHARIEVNEKGTFLEDMNSANGTEVNGEVLKYREKRVLQKGDMVSIAGERYIFC